MEILLVILCAYTVGNFLTASVVGKLFYSRNIRIEGSGNPGARNMGRVLGKKAFVITFLGDAMKGVVAVLLAKSLGLSESMQLISLLAAMLGHIFPIVAKFKGGEGISTFIGGMLAFSPLVVGFVVLAFLILQPFLKTFSATGFTAISFTPVFLLFFTKDWEQAGIALVLIVLLLLVRNRHNAPI